MDEAGGVAGDGGGEVFADPALGGAGDAVVGLGQAGEIASGELLEVVLGQEAQAGGTQGVGSGFKERTHGVVDLAGDPCGRK